MVVIRLCRLGAKGRPFFRIVVMDRRSARNAGTFLEVLGYSNDFAAPGEVGVRLDAEKFDGWVARGAQASERVRRIRKALSRSTQVAAAT